METRNQSNFVLVLACFGVVVYHLIGDDEFYIGNSGALSFENIRNYYSLNGFYNTVSALIKGFSAVIGVFLINSGYGLYKSAKKLSVLNFYKARFTKIWIYCLLCGLVCTFLVFISKGELIYSYLYSMFPVFGFYEMPREYFVMQYWYLAIIFVCYLLFPILKNAMSPGFFLVTVLFSAAVGYLIVFDVYTSVSIYHSALCRLSEFSFGILLAKDQRIEKYFFEYGFYKILIGFAALMSGYLMLYEANLSPFSYLVNSVGVYLVGVQISTLFVSKAGIANIFSRLKGGTMTVYLIHLVSINYMVDLFRKLILSYLHSDAYYFVSFILIILFTIIALLIANIIEQKYYKLVATSRA